ncbi:MAG: dynamin family protein [Gammaproteobacteria bacterium]
MLNPNQKRYIVSRLATLERELTDALAAISSGGDAVLFPRYRVPMSTDDIAALNKRLERMRVAMRQFMDAYGITHGAGGEVDGRWALLTHIALLENSIIELRPRYVQGYGALDEEGTHACQSLAAELGLLLEGMDEIVRPPAVLLETQSISTDAWAKLISEVIERYRLAEYRPRLNDLIAGGEAGAIELAVLGRVSSGKSSLINTLIGQPLLPVGSIPVTAVTTRLRYGPALAVETLDLNGRLLSRRGDELAALISEAGNQNNRLSLAEVRVQVPAPLLRDGIILTDTPGLGSLHPAASRHVLDYLPRCELGILTIDSTATLAQADVDLVRGLLDVGADVLVVLTKGDLLDAGAGDAQRAYVSGTLGKMLDGKVDVAAISMRPDWSASLNAWIADTLLAHVQDVRKGAERRHATRRKQLARQLKLILEQARDEQGNGPSESGFAAASLRLQQTQERINALIDTVRTHAVAMASDTALADWQATHASRRLDEAFSDALSACVDTSSHECLELAKQVGAQLAQHVESERRVPALPAFVANALPSLNLARWCAGSWPGSKLYVRYRLRPLEQIANAAVLAYVDRLRAWLRVTIQQMRDELRRSAAGTGAAVDREQISEDIRRLEAFITAGPDCGDAGQGRV